MIAGTLKLSGNNCYLLKAERGYVLVDTASDWLWDTFRRELEKAGVGVDDLEYVVLTHHHDDHAGLLNQLVAQNPGLRIVMSTHARERLAQGMNVFPKGAGCVNRSADAIVAQAKLNNRWLQPYPPYTARPEDILVSQGTGLRELGIGLDGRIVETPGHSIDSISVQLPEGLWLVGDAAANIGQFVETQYCAIVVDDLDQTYRSWTKMLEAGARRIYPAHGEPFAADELRRNINRNKKGDMVLLS